MTFRAPLAFALAFTAIHAAASERPQRIVSAGGDLTEIVYALGAGDRLVGVDTTSTYPDAAREIAQIGYVRRLSAEGVISLSPDLILAADDAGPAAVMEVLETAGFRIAVAPEADQADGVPGKVRFVGEAIGEDGETLARSIESSLAEVRASVARLVTRPRVLFILTLREGAPLVGGVGTSANEMIEEAGGANVAAGIQGWKPMNAEAIIAAAPDVIIMTTAHSDRLGGLDEVMARPDIALTPAGRAGRGATLDAMMLLGMGPRVADGIAALARAIHPPQAAADAGL